MRLLYIFHCFLTLFLHRRVFFCFSKCFNILVVSVIEHRYAIFKVDLYRCCCHIISCYIQFHKIRLLRLQMWCGGCWWFRFVIVDSKKNKKGKVHPWNGMKNVHKLIIERNLIPWRAMVFVRIAFFPYHTVLWLSATKTPINCLNFKLVALNESLKRMKKKNAHRIANYLNMMRIVCKICSIGDIMIHI